MTLAIVRDLLPINFAPGREGPFSVDMVVVHVMEGTMAGTHTHFRQPKTKASAHYGISVTGAIEQYVDEADTAWHAGRVDRPTAAMVLERPGMNPNSYSIGVEHEGDGKHELTNAQRAASAELIADICTRYRVTADRRHIVGHHEIFHAKPCPGAISVDRLVADVRVVWSVPSKPGRSTPAPVFPLESERIAPRYSPSLGWIVPITVVDDHDWTFATVAEIRGAISAGHVPKTMHAGTALSSLPRATHGGG